MILSITLNPTVDTTFFVDEVRPVYRTEAWQVRHMAGGKGNNVARALQALGVPARVLQPLGGSVGKLLAELLAADGLGAVHVWLPGETRLEVTVVDRQHQQQAFFSPAMSLTADGVDAIRRAFLTSLEGVEALCLCGSSPAALADELFPWIIREASRRGLFTLLDTYGNALRLGLEAAPEVVKANRAEVEALLGRSLKSRAAQLEALRALRRGGTQWIVLTLGEQGALFAEDQFTWQALPPKIEAVNPIGSGDAMTAGLLAGKLRGLPPMECFRMGMAAAAANALGWDACRISALQVQELLPQVRLERIEPSSPEEKDTHA